MSSCSPFSNSPDPFYVSQPRVNVVYYLTLTFMAGINTRGLLPADQEDYTEGRGKKIHVPKRGRNERRPGVLYNREQRDMLWLLILPAINQKSEEQKIETIRRVSGPGATETKVCADEISGPASVCNASAPHYSGGRQRSRLLTSFPIDFSLSLKLLETQVKGLYFGRPLKKKKRGSYIARSHLARMI